jgi:hypothetical protein
MKSRFLAFITTMALFALTLMIPVRFAAQDQKPTSDVTGSSTWVRSAAPQASLLSRKVSSPRTIDHARHLRPAFPAIESEAEENECGFKASNR